MVTPPAPDRLFIWRLDKNRKVATLDMPNSKIGKVEVPLQAVLRHHRHGSGRQGMHQLAGPGPARREHGLQRGRRRGHHALPGVRTGALFMLGDGHAAQGDGEIDGAAIETLVQRASSP